MSRPAHGDEHDTLATLINKSINVPSSKVKLFVLITIGEDGRPCVAGNTQQPGDMLQIFQQLLDWGMKTVQGVELIRTDKSN